MGTASAQRGGPPCSYSTVYLKGPLGHRTSSTSSGCASHSVRTGDERSGHGSEKKDGDCLPFFNTPAPTTPVRPASPLSRDRSGRPPSLPSRPAHHHTARARRIDCWDTHGLYQVPPKTPFADATAHAVRPVPTRRTASSRALGELAPPGGPCLAYLPAPLEPAKLRRPRQGARSAATTSLDSCTAQPNQPAPTRARGPHPDCRPEYERPTRRRGGGEKADCAGRRLEEGGKRGRVLFWVPRGKGPPRLVFEKGPSPPLLGRRTGNNATKAGPPTHTHALALGAIAARERNRRARPTRAPANATRSID